MNSDFHEVRHIFVTGFSTKLWYFDFFHMLKSEYRKIDKLIIDQFSDLIVCTIPSE
jgi:hypothetical protein